MPFQVLRSIITSVVLSVLGSLSIIWSIYEQEVKIITESHISPPEHTTDSPTYHPSIALDVYKVHHLFTARLGLPAELSLQILDQAAYHLRFTATRCDKQIYTHHRRTHDAEPYISLSIPGPYARRVQDSVSLGRLLRRLTLITRSRDQGWSSFPADHGTYKNSWTWFDVSILRSPETMSPTAEPNYLIETEPPSPITPMSPNREPRAATLPDVAVGVEREHEEIVKWERVVINRHGVGTLTEHVFTLGENEETHLTLDGDDDKDDEAGIAVAQINGADSLIRRDLPLVAQRRITYRLQDAHVNEDWRRGVRTGDEICVWPKAQFPGWSNHVEAAKIELYISVF